MPSRSLTKTIAPPSPVGSGGAGRRTSPAPASSRMRAAPRSARRRRVTGAPSRSRRGRASATGLDPPRLRHLAGRLRRPALAGKDVGEDVVSQRGHLRALVHLEALPRELRRGVESPRLQLLAGQEEEGGPELRGLLGRLAQLGEEAGPVAALPRELGEVEARAAVVGEPRQLLAVEPFGASDVTAGLQD